MHGFSIHLFPPPSLNLFTNPGTVRPETFRPEIFSINLHTVVLNAMIHVNNQMIQILYNQISPSIGYRLPFLSDLDRLLHEIYVDGPNIILLNMSPCGMVVLYVKKT